MNTGVSMTSIHAEGSCQYLCECVFPGHTPKTRDCIKRFTVIDFGCLPVASLCLFVLTTDFELVLLKEPATILVWKFSHLSSLTLVWPKNTRIQCHWHKLFLWQHNFKDKRQLPFSLFAKLGDIVMGIALLTSQGVPHYAHSQGWLVDWTRAVHNHLIWSRDNQCLNKHWGGGSCPIPSMTIITQLITLFLLLVAS